MKKDIVRIMYDMPSCFVWLKDEDGNTVAMDDSFESEEEILEFCRMNDLEYKELNDAIMDRVFADIEAGVDLSADKWR